MGGDVVVRVFGASVAAVLFAVVALAPAPPILLAPVFLLGLLALTAPVAARWALRAVLVGSAVYVAGRLLGRGVRDGRELREGDGRPGS